MSRPIIVMWLLKISKNMSEELKMCRENRGIIICVILPDNNSKHSKLYSSLIYFSSLLINGSNLRFLTAGSRFLWFSVVVLLLFIAMGDIIRIAQGLFPPHMDSTS